MKVNPDEIFFDTVRKSVRRLFPSLLIISCVVNLLLLVSAIYMLQVYDRVLSTGSLDTLAWLTLAALFAIVVYGALEQVRRIILGRASFWVESELSEPVLRKTMSDRLAGRNTDAGLPDIAALRSFLGGDAILAFFDAPWTPIFIAFIWLLHPGLGVLAVGSAVTLFLLALVNDMVTRQPQKEIAGRLRRSDAQAQQFAESGETISPLGMSGSLLGNWRAFQRETRHRSQDLKEKTSAIASTSRALRLALQVMILGLGAYYVLQGALTPGGMIAASIILGRALAPIERSIGAWQSFISARNATARLRGLFGGAKPHQYAVKLPRPSGRLQVENLYCLAPVSGEPILQDISFALDPGDTLVIFGPSGSGKSTLCRLLVGAWKPVRGNVRLDGADVNVWDPEDLGPYLGYLPQNVELFPGTVAQNIARMRDVDDAVILKAAMDAGVHDLILRLPDGYETDVGVHGSRISGGQRQRLGLARALLGDPSLVVLDEPSSNLDQAGEAALTEALVRLKDMGRTVVVVTHRPVGLRSADKVLVLNEGVVAAFGPREQVLQIRGQAPAGERVRRTRIQPVSSRVAE